MKKEADMIFDEGDFGSATTNSVSLIIQQPKSRSLRNEKPFEFRYHQERHYQDQFEAGVVVEQVKDDKGS